MNTELLEWLSLMTTTVVLCWLLHRTTNIAYWIGLSDNDKSKWYANGLLVIKRQSITRTEINIIGFVVRNV